MTYPVPPQLSPFTTRQPSAFSPVKRPSPLLPPSLNPPHGNTALPPARSLQGRIQTSPFTRIEDNLVTSPKRSRIGEYLSPMGSSASFSSESPPTPVCPGTPRRPKPNLWANSPRNVGNLSPFVRNALDIIETSILTRGIYPYPIKIVLNMRGQHSQIYELNAPTRQLMPGVANDQIYIKIFQKQIFEYNKNTIVLGFIKNSLQQYEQLLAAKIPVIQIFNHLTAEQDGYLIVEKVTPFKLVWNTEKSLDDWSEQEKKEIKEVRRFFDYAFQDNSLISLDLSPSNLGWNKQNQLCLLDFMEHKEEDDFGVTSHAFHLNARKCLNDFAKGNDDVYRYLCEGIIKTFPSLYESLNESDPNPVRFDPETLTRLL